MKTRIAIVLAILLPVVTAAAPAHAAGPERSQAASADSAYVCPMHPEVRSSSPGACKKCGMTLTKPAVSNRGEARAPGKNKMEFKIPDTTVVDQNGRKLRFYTDLVKGKTVVINFIFTTCTTICPPLTATMRRVQQDLAGRDVRLISVSVDPTTDVPQRLKSFAQKFNAAEGWSFVTGEKLDIDLLLESLGGYSANKNDHTPMILIGNESAGYWTRTYGLAPPQTIIKILDEASARSSGSQ